YVPPDQETQDTAGTATVTVTAAGLTQQVTLNLAAVTVPGHRWDVALAPRPEWNAVAAGDTDFVAVGERGALWHSDDGATWTVHDEAAGHRWVAVARGDAGWVSLSPDNTIATSADGQNWTITPDALPGFANPLGAGNSVNELVYANGRFVVA